MIDLSHKPTRKKDNDEFHPMVERLILAAFALFFTFVLLSGIAGEMIIY